MNKRWKPEGLHVKHGWLSKQCQTDEVLDELRRVVVAAPPLTPTLTSGQPLRLRVTSAGACGWWSDRSGYRYIDKHPSGSPWPEIPELMRHLHTSALRDVRLPHYEPDSMLLNLYEHDGSLGMHRDRTEEVDEPIVSLSLGADAVFRIEDDGDKMEVVLSHGDLLVQSGPSRHMLHGIKAILPTLTSPLPSGRRVNVTWRRARRSP